MAKYAGDLTFPGMLHARVLRPPAHGAKLKGVDTTAAEKIPGVQVVRGGEMLALLHEYRDVADKALALVKAQFETVLIDNSEDAASGCGEPAIVAMGAVIANAIYDAVGARLLQLPMTPARVKEKLPG